MNARKFALPALAPLLLLGLAGTAIAGHPAKIDSSSINAGSAKSVRVDLSMQPGNLTVRGGANHLFDARFDYHPPAWKPTVSYSVSGTRGHLVVRQPQLQSVKSSRNTWTVKLADRMPMDLKVTSGPGNASLTLRSLRLNTLAVAAGPGNMTIDAASPTLKNLTVSVGPGNLSVNLNTQWKHGVAAVITAGNGNTTVQLPAHVSAQVTIKGPGRVHAPGFVKQGGAYVNSAFGHSKATVRVSATSGLGNVYLKTSE